VSHRVLDSGRHALTELSQALLSIQPDKNVNDTLSTIGLLDTMRLAWLSGHVIPPDNLRGTSDGKRDDRIRRDAARAHRGLSSTSAFHKRHQPLGELLRDFCECPWPNNRNSPSWLNRMTEARVLLAKFWKSVRDEWKQDQDQRDPMSPVTDTVMGYMSFDVSARYLAEVEEERITFLVEAHRSRPATIPKQEDAHAVQTVWGHEPEQTKRPRTHPKKTSIAEDNELDLAGLKINEEPHTYAINAPTKPTIAVKQDSKSVFDKVFSRTATTSNFRWNHLVDALIDTGMVATQAAGSAVRFENDQGSIVSHQPHGYNHNSTLGADYLRFQIGKRLTKWFEWDAETFVERKKDGQ
jgi:hypothetical protein